MKTFGKFVLAIAAIVGLAVGADAVTYYRTIVQNTTYKGFVQFENPVSFLGEVTMSSTSGTLSAADVAASDDLTVGDDATITGDLAVTGSITSIGGATSPLVLSAAKSRIYHGTKTLTEAGGAETVFTVTTATTQVTGVIVHYAIRITDGTDFQVSTGTVVLSMVNKGGTVTATYEPADVAEGVTDRTAVQALSSGTATGVFAFTAAANAAAFSVDIDSSLTSNAASMEWTAVLLGPGTVS